MIKLEYECMTGRKITDEEYRIMERVRTNTPDAVNGKLLADLYRLSGFQAVMALYSMAEERGRMIEDIGDLKRERSELQREIRELRRFREYILKAYESWK